MDQVSTAFTIVGLKTLYSSIIFILSIIFTPLPLIFPINARLMSLGNTFSGGVFLSIGIIHLLRESVESLTKTIGDIYPYIICLSGTLLVFFVEKVALNRDHNIQDDLINLYEGYISNMLSHVEIIPPEYAGNSALIRIEDPGGRENLLQNAEVLKSHQSNDNGDVFIPFMLTLVLSIHGTIAGITMGMHQDEDIVTALFIAIIAHKWIECLSLGISMKKNSLVWFKAMTMIIAYSLMVPLGIGIGSFADIWLSGNTLDIVSGCFLAMSAGTFLYVAFIDILSSEFAESNNKYLKFMFLILGGVLAAVFILFFDFD